MKRSTLLLAAACLGLSSSAPQDSETPTVASMPPVVVQTIPPAGSTDIDPGVTEISVSFSKEMTDGSWSWSTAWKDSSPEFVDPPRYDKEKRTCTARVELEAGRPYGFWLNSNNFGNFKDADGRKAVPYLWVFETKPDKDSKKR